MRLSSPIDFATELLRQVLSFASPADGVVSEFCRQHRNLGHRDRQALAETVYAVIRQRRLYAHLARTGSGPIERRLAMLAWRGAPEALSAALTADEQAWRASALEQMNAEELGDELRHNLPDWLVQPLKDGVGAAEFWPLVESLNAPAPLDLRVNVLKVKREHLAATLREAGVESVETPFSPWGLRVEGKPSLGRSPAFERGEFEIQDEGSQLLALLTEARRGETVVDFCAGGGGKTLALGAMMRNTGRLYAFDVSGHRLEGLKLRLARSGLTNVYPTQIAHERDERITRLAGKVDRVLVDAPCSGLGTLRRNPDLKWRHKPAAIEVLQEQQAAILASAARMLKPGGRLVYATCSLLESENESIARGFSDKHADFEPLPVVDLLKGAKLMRAEELARGDFLRLWPHRHATDGFFAAVWRRK